MVEEVSPELRLRKIDELINLDEVKHNDLMSEKHKKTCKHLNYVEHLIIFVSTVTDCVSIFSFASLVWVPVGITSSAIGIKICATTREIKKYKSVIKKKKKKHDKMVLWGKDKPNTFEFLISKTLIDSYICHDDFQ